MEKYPFNLATAKHPVNRGNHSCGSMGGTAGAGGRESSRDPRLNKGQGNRTAGSLSSRECWRQDVRTLGSCLD